MFLSRQTAPLKSNLRAFPTRFLSTTTPSPSTNDLKARIRFNGHQAQLVDLFTSFSRQAAQAMNIKTSKTIYPIKNTPDLHFQPLEFDPESTAAQSLIDSTPSAGAADVNEVDMKLNWNINEAAAIDSRGISFSYERWTVNRSPFVHGRHQDQFEIRTYHRDLELYDATSETVKRWLHYVTMNMPFGVGLDYSIRDYEQFPVDAKTTDSSTKHAQENQQ